VVISPRLLRTGALVFLLVTSLHSAGLIYYSRHSFPTATIGARCTRLAGQHAMRVEDVSAGSAAARAGLHNEDHIHAVNGQQLITAYPFWDAIGAHPATPLCLPCTMPMIPRTAT
jgi:predicted metalloprotease with PDZ domain